MKMNFARQLLRINFADAIVSSISFPSPPHTHVSLLCISFFGLFSFSQVNFRIVKMQFCSLSCGSLGGVDISYMSK